MCPVDVVVGRADRVPVDAGVVDEGVEVAHLGADPLLSGDDLILIRDVELDGHDALDLFDVVGVTRPGIDHEVVIRRELARDLRADSPARAGDQRDATQILFRSRSFLPISIRWISEVPSPIKSRGASR